MQVEDFDATLKEVSTREDLLQLLASGPAEGHRSFNLYHDNGTTLAVFMNGRFAYLYFFPDENGDEAGSQSWMMTPPGCPEVVQVLQPGGSLADGFEIPAEFIVSLDDACKCACEYLETRTRPTCIPWMDL